MIKKFLPFTALIMLLVSCAGTPVREPVSIPAETGAETDAGASSGTDIGTERPPEPVPEKIETLPADEEPAPKISEEIRPPAAEETEAETPLPQPPEQTVSEPEDSVEKPADPPQITLTGKTDIPEIIKPQTEAVKPKILEKKDLAAAVMAKSTDMYTLVYHQTGPLLYFVDENRDGLLDAGAVFVSLKEGNSKAQDLMNMARLYNSQAELYDFYYQSFLQKDGALIKHKAYFLGTHVVIQGMKEIRIKPEPGAINVLSVVFPTTEGTENEWIIFSPAGVSRFSLKENFSTYPVIYDPDEDGVQDIVIFSKIFEEGIGVETFVTWYKWKTTAFAEHYTVNIVRNLNLFLGRARDLLIQNKIEAFFEFALKSSDAASYKQKIGGRENPLFSVFSPIAQEKPDKDLLFIKDLKIYDITFPEILENPFMQKSVKDFTFSPIIKLTTSAGAYFLTAAIKMASNPFTSPKQFYFLPQ